MRICALTLMQTVCQMANSVEQFFQIVVVLAEDAQPWQVAEGGVKQQQIGGEQESAVLEGET